MDGLENSLINHFWNDLINSQKRIAPINPYTCKTTKSLRHSLSYGYAIFRRPNLELGEDRLEIPQSISQWLKELSDKNKNSSKLHIEAQKAICRIKIRFSSESISFLYSAISKLHNQSNIIGRLARLERIQFSPILPIIHKKGDKEEEGTFHNDYFPDSNAGTRIAWIALTNYEYPGIQIKPNQHLLQEKLLKKLSIENKVKMLSKMLNKDFLKVINLREFHKSGNWAAWNDTLTHKGIFNTGPTTSSAAIIRFSKTHNRETFINFVEKIDNKDAKTENNQLMNRACQIIDDAIALVESSTPLTARSAFDSLKNSYKGLDELSAFKIISMAGFGINLMSQRVLLSKSNVWSEHCQKDYLLKNIETYLTAINCQRSSLLNSL